MLESFLVKLHDGEICEIFKQLRWLLLNDGITFFCTYFRFIHFILDLKLSYQHMYQLNDCKTFTLIFLVFKAEEFDIQLSADSTSQLLPLISVTIAPIHP